MRYWFYLNLYRGIGVSRFGRFRGCIILRGICDVWMIQVTHMYESCHTYKWVASIYATDECEDTKKKQITSGTFEWVMSLLWANLVCEWILSHIILSCIMSHIWMNLVYEGILYVWLNWSHIQVRRVTFGEIMSHIWMHLVAYIYIYVYICIYIYMYIYEWILSQKSRDVSM